MIKLFFKGIVLFGLIFCFFVSTVSSVVIRVKDTANPILENSKSCSVSYEKKYPKGRILNGEYPLSISSTDSRYKECTVNDSDITSIVDFSIANQQCRFDKSVNLNGCDCIEFRLNPQNQLKFVALRDLHESEDER